jgi:hypothetical protein
VVELAAAVIGNVDDLHAVLDGDQRVLDRGDALDDERNVGVLVLESLDLLPGEARLEAAALRGARATA